jgi:hypothetical protein
MQCARSSNKIRNKKIISYPFEMASAIYGLSDLLVSPISHIANPIKLFLPMNFTSEFTSVFYKEKFYDEK